MSILIKGMEMPKEGRITIQIGDDGAVYTVTSCKITTEVYEKKCPAIEVPEPHGELIDRHEAYLRFGKLAETLEEKNGYEAGAPYAMAALFLNNVEEFPTIIPASEEGLVMGKKSPCLSCKHKNVYDPLTKCFVCIFSGIECKNFEMYKPKPQTNADRIRSMSDGELAQFLMDSFACSLNCPAYDICDAEGACVEFLAKWLQQEAES